METRPFASRIAVRRQWSLVLLPFVLRTRMRRSAPLPAAAPINPVWRQEKTYNVPTRRVLHSSFQLVGNAAHEEIRLQKKPCASSHNKKTEL